MRFFASKIYDKDMCFLRDLVRVMTDLNNHGVSQFVLQKKVNAIIREKGLEDALEKISHYNDYEIKDCYPSDRTQLVENASKIMSLFEVCPDGEPSSISATFDMMKNMQLTREECKHLILKHIIHSVGIDEFDSYLADKFLDSLF